MLSSLDTGRKNSLQTKPNRYDLNWQLCNKEFRSIDKVVGLEERSLAYSFVRFALGATKALLFACKKDKPLNSQILFFVSSRNQYNALKNVAQRVQNGSIVEMCNPTASYADFYFPLHSAYLQTIIKFKAVFADYKTAQDVHLKRIYRSRGDLLALAPALQEVITQYLKRMNPKVIIVSNDVVLWTRTIISAAKNLGIKTVYMQHACVSNIVPPLEIDYAFLDGRDAARKYISKTPLANCEVFLAGGARHDSIVKLRESSKQKVNKMINVGLCVNMTDDLNAVRRIASLLSKNAQKYSVTIRPHPRERRIKILKAIAIDTSSDWSDPSVQCSVQFIHEHDVIIAGDSSILLDAALGGRKAIKFEMMGVGEDYFGLIKSGISLLAKNDEHLLFLLEMNYDVQESKLRNYYAPYGTFWESKSSALIASAICNLASDGGINRKNWKRNITMDINELVH